MYFIVAMMILILIVCAAAMFFFFRTYNREKAERNAELQRKKADQKEKAAAQN